jgi:hypothetical protein
MKRRSKDDLQAGTPHHAARGHVALWATIMSKAKPRANGTHAEIARQLLEAIELDETRKSQGQPHVL